MHGQSKFSLFTSRIRRDRFEFEGTRVSAYGYPVFEMCQYAGELPRKFASFHCLENECNKLKRCDTEGPENFPDLPQNSEFEIVILEETYTSLIKRLAVLQVAGAKESTVRDSEYTKDERIVMGSQKCFLSSGDEGSERLETFLRDKPDSLGGEGLESIVKVDPAVVPELLNENFVDRGSAGTNKVPVDKKCPGVV